MPLRFFCPLKLLSLFQPNAGAPRLKGKNMDSTYQRAMNANVYLYRFCGERTAAFLQKPPGAEWDGTTTIDAK